LYVEGARDREILGCWARRLDVGLARYIEKNTVILGGRRPARAISDFRKRGGVDAGFSGLIVLDRDDHPHAASGSVTPAENGDASTLSTGSARVEDGTAEAGLELFVWGLRHIESYLLVPVHNTFVLVLRELILLLLTNREWALDTTTVVEGFLDFHHNFLMYIPIPRLVSYIPSRHQNVRALEQLTC